MDLGVDTGRCPCMVGDVDFPSVLHFYDHSSGGSYRNTRRRNHTLTIEAEKRIYASMYPVSYVDFTNFLAYLRHLTAKLHIFSGIRKRDPITVHCESIEGVYRERLWKRKERTLTTAAEDGPPSVLHDAKVEGRQPEGEKDTMMPWFNLDNSVGHSGRKKSSKHKRTRVLFNACAYLRDVHDLQWRPKFKMVDDMKACVAYLRDKNCAPSKSHGKPPFRAPHRPANIPPNIALENSRPLARDPPSNPRWLRSRGIVLRGWRQTQKLRRFGVR